MVAGLIVLVSPFATASQQQIATPVPTMATDGRRWSAADSVAVRYFDPESVEVSPDGSKLFFVAFQGDISCDCNVYQLTVFDVADVRKALSPGGSPAREVPQPVRIVTRRSASHAGAGIGGAQWESDSQSITFVGPSESGVRQLYTLDIKSGAVTELTNWPYGVGFPVRVGKTMISDVSLPVEGFHATYPAYAITRDSAQAALFPQGRSVTFVSFRGGSPWSLEQTDPDNKVEPSVSPDGRRVVLVRDPKEVPGSWAAYDRLPVSSDDGRMRSEDARRFVVVDAEHRTERPVFDAPAGTATRLGLEQVTSVYPGALWARDSRHVVLLNTALPLTAGADPGRRGMAYVVGYDADTGQWTVIEPLEQLDRSGRPQRRITQVGWLAQGSELLIRHEVAGKPASGTVYTLKGDRWTAKTVAPSLGLPVTPDSKPPALKYGLKVTLRQSANDPPTVVASNGSREIALTTPDPALTGVTRARQDAFEWREPGGQLITGGLLLPPKQSDHPVPLVIQAYSYDPDAFKPDGPETNAYGAQSLVARGIAVLNVPIPGMDPTKLGTVRELTDYVVEVDSAASALAERGLIDRARVGEIGFSHAGFEVYYAITHPGEFPPVAAVLDDSFPGTFSYFLDAHALIGGNYGHQYGGSFWSHKAEWLDYEPSFNVDRVETAALFTIHDQHSLPIALETIGAFGLNHRPLEYLIFPRASHQLEMPRERLASQETSVDWMAFWLLGEVPPDGKRAARWAVLRAQQQAVLEEAAKKGEKRAPLPELHLAPEWAIQAWRDAHRLIGDLAADGTHLVATPEKDETAATKH